VPKGYRGLDHQTMGCNILAVLKSLRLPEQLLGKEEAEQLARVEPRGWYPVGRLLDLMETVDRSLGHYALLQMGRKLFQTAHERRVLESARSARDILYGMEEMYRYTNRGVALGGFQVLAFEPGHAELETTTPYHCAMEQGLLTAALTAVGCPVNLGHRRCFREGAETCIFVVSSSLTDQRWSGAER